MNGQSAAQPYPFSLRESLTIAALALVLVLTAALLGPYFFDWSQARGLIEQRLSDSLGMSVKIAGQIDVKLLPTPYLVAGNLTTQPKLNADGNTLDITFHARSVRLELAPMALLSGDFTFTDVRFDQPDVVLAVNHELNPQKTPPASPKAAVHFDHIAIDDGAFTLVDHDHEVMKLRGINAIASATSLAGPFKADGTFTLNNGPVDFHLNTGAIENQILRLKLNLAATKSALNLGFDGAAALNQQTFDGAIKSSGTIKLADQTVPFALSGPTHLDLAKGSSDALELRLGDDDHSAKFNGTIRYETAPKLRLATELAATTLDLDTIFAPAPNERPRPAELLAKARQILADFSRQGKLFPGTVALNIDSLVLGQDSLTGLHFATDTTTAATKIQLSGTAPANTPFSFDGAVGSPTNSLTEGGLDGWLDISSRNFGRLQNWFYAEEHASPFFKTSAFKGQVHIGNGFSSPNAQLTLDRSNLTGSVRFLAAQGPKNSQLTLNLASDALDLDSIPDLGAISGQSAGQIQAGDLDVKLDARTVKLAKLGQGPVESGRIQLDMSRQNQTIMVKTLNLENIGGASLNGSGTIGPTESRFSVRINAPQFGDLASLLKRLFPGTLTNNLKARAAVLAPIQLDIQAESGGAKAENLLNWRTFSANGTLASTKLNFDLKDASTASLHLESPRITHLFAQLGLPTLPIDSLGSANLDLKIPDLTQPAPHVDLNALLAGTELNANGQINAALKTIDGQWSLKGRDAAPLLQAMAVLLPDAQTAMPVNLSGAAKLTPDGLDATKLDGQCATSHLTGNLALDWSGAPLMRGTLNLDHLDISTVLTPIFGADQPVKTGAIWSDVPFQTSIGDLPNSQIQLNIGKLALGNTTAQDASLGLDISMGHVALSPIKMQLWTGLLTGSASLRRAGQTGSLNADMQFERFKLASTMLNGAVSGQLNLAGSGQSWAGLIGSLAGTGTITPSNSHVKMIAPEGLARVVNAAEQDKLNSDASSLDKALHAESDQGQVSISPVSTALTLAGGQLKFGPGILTDTSASPNPNPAKWSATYNLRTAQFDFAASIALWPLPKNWKDTAPSLDMRWQGSLDNPQRNLDVANLANALAARAIARSQARIEALDADIRERSFFVRRLKASRAADVRQKIEDDLRRKAEEDAARRQAEEILKPHLPPESAPLSLVPPAAELPPLGLPAQDSPMQQN
eukprot:gene13399-13514_t